MKSERRQRIAYLVSDLLMSLCAWFSFNVIRFYNVEATHNNYHRFSDFLATDSVWQGLILFPLMMLVIYNISGYYNKVFLKSRAEEFITTLTTAITGAIAIYFLAIVDDPIPDRASNYILLLMLTGLMFSLVYAGRITLTMRNIRLVKEGKLSFNALTIGPLQCALELRKEIGENYSCRKALPLNIVGCIDTSNKNSSPTTHIPTYGMSDIEDVCKKLDIRYIIVASRHNETQQALETISSVFHLGIPVLVSHSLSGQLTSRRKLRRIESSPLIDITRAQMSDSAISLKRTGDIIVSVIVLLLLIPLFTIIAAAIKMDSKGNVIYSQERIGLRKKPFRIYKFRTMRTDAESNGPALSSANDSRITKIGHYLRKYRIDELPQFWNVLIGDMSLVGPRPERAFYIDKIMQKAPYYMLVHQVRPGLTSLGMVKHGYASSVDEMIERLQYDLVYLENISLIVDLKILLYTVNTVVTGKGV